MQTDLFSKLIKYSDSDIYSFAMPGHKRRVSWNIPNPYSIDITEIEGFDNLHNPSGVLKDIEDKAARICKSKYAFMSVNGSSAGVLAALFAIPSGSNVLIARNCHKSVYDGCALNRLNITAFEPERIPELKIYGGVKPQSLEEIFQAGNSEKKGLSQTKSISKVSAVVITSPTYEGFVSDIRKIAEIAHSHNAMLIVDSAHGAHFHYSDAFPVPAQELGADIVIESLHKTMPSLNQTALVSVNDDALAGRVRRRMDALLTTSPSYILMAGIDRCLTAAESGELDFEGYVERLKRCRKELGGIICAQYAKGAPISSEKEIPKSRKLRIAGRDLIGRFGIYDIDISKIVLYSPDDSVCGQGIYEYMLNEHHLQFEAAGLRHVLAMTSVMDSDEGFNRLKLAVEKFLSGEGDDCAAPRQICSQIEEIEENSLCEKYIYLYPPGSPIVIPGEIFTKETKEYITIAARQGLNVIIKEHL